MNSPSAPPTGFSLGSIWYKDDGMYTVQHRRDGLNGAAWNGRAGIATRANGADGSMTYLTALRDGAAFALVAGTDYPATTNTIGYQTCLDWSLGTTDKVVVVANEYSGDIAVDTAYQVFGLHVFTASPSSVDGSAANFVRVRTFTADGSVLSTESVEGVTYAYAVGTSPTKVSIEFRKTNPFTLIIR